MRAVGHIDGEGYYCSFDADSKQVPARHLAKCACGSADLEDGFDFTRGSTGELGSMASSGLFLISICEEANRADTCTKSP